MNIFGRWLRGTAGVTAVEFSLVGLPFIVMMIGTIEMAMMFTTQSLLEASTSTAARMIRTGQIQQAPADEQEDMFRDAVCNFASILIPCAAIQFQVVELPDFGAAGDMPEAEFDDDGNLQDQGFSTGGSSDVVLIRVAYNYPIVTPMMQPVLNNDGNGGRQMLSTVVLRTEPYDFDGGGG